MKLSLILGFLLPLVLADNELTMTCKSCYINDYCASVQGADFSNATIRVSSYSNYCHLFPNNDTIKVSFKCVSLCDGCQIQLTDGVIHTTHCSEEVQGKKVTAYLNNWYRRYNNITDVYETNDWCNCGLSAGVIAGIIAGAVVGFCVICYLLVCLCDRCNQSS